MVPDPILTAVARRLACAALSAALTLSACGDDRPKGEPCEDNGDCASGACAIFSSRLVDGETPLLDCRVCAGEPCSAREPCADVREACVPDVERGGGGEEGSGRCAPITPRPELCSP
jgi:hypothetical protein